MPIGLPEFLVALLLGSAILGIAGTLRGTRRADRFSWWLCAAIVCCVAAGVWRYVQQGRWSALQNERMQADLERFVTPRPVRVKSTDALTIELIVRIACDELRDATLRETCGTGRVLRDEDFAPAARAELWDRFVAGLEIGLWPAHRIMQADNAPMFRYVVEADDAAALMLRGESSRDTVLLTVYRAMARPAISGVQRVPPFLDVDSAGIRVSFGRACAGRRCELRAARLVTDGRTFCVDGVRRSGDYRGKLQRCSGVAQNRGEEEF